MPPAAIAAGAAIVGGIAGAQQDVTTATSTINLTPASRLEKQAFDISGGQLGELEGLVGLGAGGEDVTAGLEAQRSLAEQLEGLRETGGLPGQEDIAAARGFTTDIFAPERVGIQQGFAQQEQRTAQLAARLGRSVSDPILQARLAQEQTQQFERLGARETSFAAQEARRLPLQRLQFGGALADVRQGLASQAFSNRQALFQLGQQALGSERAFRIGTAGKTIEQRSGGGFKGAIEGAGQAFGAVAGIGGIGGLGGGGGSSGGAGAIGAGFAPQAFNTGISAASGATGGFQFLPPASFQAPASGGPAGIPGLSTGFLVG